MSEKPVELLPAVPNYRWRLVGDLGIVYHEGTRKLLGLPYNQKLIEKQFVLEEVNGNNA